MMTLQLVSNNESLLNEIADYLLEEQLIANAMISEMVTYKTKNAAGRVETSRQYSLKGISKSLLFSRINVQLQNKYQDRMPLLYSEPIILIDSEQLEGIMALLAKV